MSSSAEGIRRLEKLSGVPEGSTVTHFPESNVSRRRKKQANGVSSRRGHRIVMSHIFSCSEVEVNEKEPHGV